MVQVVSQSQGKWKRCRHRPGFKIDKQGFGTHRDADEVPFTAVFGRHGFAVQNASQGHRVPLVKVVQIKDDLEVLRGMLLKQLDCLLVPLRSDELARVRIQASFLGSGPAEGETGERNLNRSSFRRNDGPKS